MVIFKLNLSKESTPKITALQKKKKRKSAGVKTILRENKTEGLILSDFKVYYKVTVIKIVSYWHKSRHTDQWNTTEGLKINPYSYDELIFERAPPKNK